MRFAICFFGLSLGVGILAALGAGAPNPATAPAAAAGVAPEFSLIDQDDHAVSLSDFKGKVVVLEWVNPHCPFVQRHYKAGTMVNLASRYKNKGVVWLSINSTQTDSIAANKKWAQLHSAPYPVLDDHLSAVAREYGAKSTPHMFVINAAGKIVYQGAIDDDAKGEKKDPLNYVDKALAEALADKPVSTPSTVPYGCTVKYKD
jgi:peroxiredoxin